jgi:hypothetical protein
MQFLSRSVGADRIYTATIEDTPEMVRRLLDAGVSKFLVCDDRDGSGGVQIIVNVADLVSSVEQKLESE